MYIKCVLSDLKMLLPSDELLNMRYMINDLSGHSDDAIAINYCILYAKHFIYREKLNNQN